MGLGLQGGFGAKGGQDALETWIARRLAQQAEAENQRATMAREGMAQQELNQRQSQHVDRMGIDTRGLDLEEQRMNAPAAQPEPARPMLMSPGQQLVHPEDGRIIASSPDRQKDPTEKGPYVVGGHLVTGEGKTLFAAPDKPGSSDAGWRIQSATDPSTNRTVMMRVNERTGESHQVELPPGLQPGGQRQTRLTAGQQEDLATMKTVEDMATQASALGEKLKWSGVGGLYTGSVSQMAAKHLGIGNPEQEELRNYIGNIQGTIAKLRGGTSFTPNEQKLLESYTPTINDSDLTIKSKLKSLNNFISIKRQNTLQFAGADAVAPQEAPAKPSAADLINKYRGQR